MSCYRSKTTITRTLLLVSIAASAARAHTLPSSPSSTAAPIVVAAYRDGRPDDKSLEIGDTLAVKVESFSDWITQGKAETDGKPSTEPRDPDKLILFLDGYPMKGLNPSAWLIDEKGTAILRIALLRNADNKDTWTALLTRQDTQATVTVGIPGSVPFRSSQRIQVIAGNPAAKISSAIGFICLLIAFGVITKKSFLLRDRTSTRPWQERPYSLGRCQMALWFFTVLGSYIAMAIILKSLDVIPYSVLALVGISAATGLAGAVVDLSKSNEASTKLRGLQEEQQNRISRLQAIAAQFATPTAPAPGTAERATLLSEQAKLTAEMTLARDQLAELSNAVNGPKSENFLMDLLTDADGVSFYRFQIFTWTIVLWVIFVGTVVRTLAMPDFSDQVLGLLGISSGTYLGFKFPEKK